MERSSPGPLRMISSRNPRVQSQPSSLGPEAINDSGLPYFGTHAVYRRNSTAYSCGVKFPPQPQDSLPTPQKRTSKGSADPPAVRLSAKVVLPAGELRYSTHWENASAGRLRTLAAR